MSRFTLNSQDIKNGLEKYSQSCACCLLLGVKPASGYVKGINTTPSNRADETKWLIEAEIVVVSIHNNQPVDTIWVKQYFYPIRVQLSIMAHRHTPPHNSGSYIFQPSAQSSSPASVA